MLIKLTTDVYGNLTGKKGDEVEVADALAANLIRGGFAVEVKPVEQPQVWQIGQP